MRNLLNPKWLLLLNTLPIIVLAALCYSQYSIIESLLPLESQVLWPRFGLVLMGLGLLTLGYTGWRIGKGQPLEAWYAVLTLAAYSAYLCLFAYHSGDLVPFSIPRWMVPTPLLVYVATFLMPTLAHALFVLVLQNTAEVNPHRAWLSILLAFLIPFAWFLLSQLPGPLWWSNTVSWLGGATVVALVVLCTVTFLYFLVRAAYIIGLNQAGRPSRYALVWKVLIGIVLPLLGLAINNGLVFRAFGAQEAGIFGNFSSPWFYGLALLNGVLLCISNPTTPGLRLRLFLGRSVLLGYTFYFFLVFLPFLPFSIFAVILIGTGFLMLTPLVLLVVHVRELSADFTALQSAYPQRWLRAGLVGGALVLPLVVTGRYLHNRHVLHEALAYRYSPDYSRTYQLDADALATTLEVVKQNKDRTVDFMFSTQKPYLSAWFNWLVLDNLTLSDDKIAGLEQLFFGRRQELNGAQLARPVFNTTPLAGAFLSDLSASSTYDASQQAWVSSVKLKIANSDPTQLGTEYATTLALPVGCWVSGYYLDIGNRREPGILAERKAAAWVYQQIINENRYRDPGLLSYLDANHVSLRVFPVVRNEVRTTGLQLLHKEPLTLTVDGRQVTLGDTATVPVPAAPVATPDNGVVYVSAAAKKKLPLVQRKPYYHFLLDVSVNKADSKNEWQQRLDEYLSQTPAAAATARFSLVNTYSELLPVGANWKKELSEFTNAGGFYLAGAVRKILYEAHEQPSATYPVLVVVTDDIRQAVTDQNYADLSAAYPESDLFYVLGANGKLIAHSLRTNSTEPLPNSTTPTIQALVRAWPNAAQPRAYLPNNTSADIVLGQSKIGLPDATTAKNRWQTGLLLRGFGQWQALHPEATDAQRIPFVKASFQTGILTPFTSYLALENEAQKAALRRKQQQTLAGNAALDASENEQRQPPAGVPIDEVAGLLLAAGILFGLWGLRRTSG